MVDKLGCVTVNSSLIKNCFQIVNYLVPGSLDEAEVVELDQLSASQSGGGPCPFLGLEFNCLKNFPHCVALGNTTEVLKMCKKSCVSFGNQEGLCKGYDIKGICSGVNTFFVCTVSFRSIGGVLLSCRTCSVTDPSAMQFRFQMQN